MSTAGASSTWATLQEEPEFKERRAKIVKLLHVQMMDFRFNNPEKLAACTARLLQIFDNILQNPNAEKYRKVNSLSEGSYHAQSGQVFCTP